MLKQIMQSDWLSYCTAHYHHLYAVGCSQDWSSPPSGSCFSFNLEEDFETLIQLSVVHVVEAESGWKFAGGTWNAIFSF